MGCRSTICGLIEFTPALNAAELRALQPIDDPLFRFVETRSVELTDRGKLTVISASTIAPVYTDEVKAYTAVEDLQALVDQCPPGAKFEGRIRIEGEDNGDVRLLFVETGQVVEWRAKLLWPDGTTEESSRS